MYRIFVSILIGSAVLYAHPGAFASGDTSLPANAWISAAPIQPIARSAGSRVSSEIRASSIESGGMYHLVLPPSQGNGITNSVGRNLVGENLKKMLNEPFSPTGVRAFHFEPDGLPSIVSVQRTTSDPFSLSQLAQLYLDKYVMPQSIKRLIPKTPSLNF